ncbi:hypothetical protein BX616_010167 [Lobosporangium transversale]|uniref:RING-type domain-containing protein n=1 Tax=Lobosporangium transversale TaxID=64571 RepID=A0A1Y2GFE4_9FUNG|nr:hypothetical protein BCR41DRAFT_424611 [Lobosporangium transversale]KAF9913203.1 hypothetical protein BX616_010167 [Lobosporangium transversale]ORZ07995.1 hypothetical protein BCR41DRAFT_424611 [Lobosporangium transversale]|eukprot:XP_021878229.1 hypothetical protein BCR41DRAFT_424611 [Lobosporangium transversale]
MSAADVSLTISKSSARSGSESDSTITVQNACKPVHSLDTHAIATSSHQQILDHDKAIEAIEATGATKAHHSNYHQPSLPPLSPFEPISSTSTSPTASTTAPSPPPSPSPFPSPSLSLSPLPSHSCYYSPVTTPYPIVYSSPSLIDSARSASSSASALHSLSSSPFTSHPPLRSSIPPPPLYSLPLSLSLSLDPSQPQSQQHISNNTTTRPLSLSLSLSSPSSPSVHASGSYPQLESHSNSYFPPLYQDWRNIPSIMSTYPPPPLSPVIPSIPQLSTHSPQSVYNLGDGQEQANNSPTPSLTNTSITTTNNTRPRSVLDLAIDTASTNPAGRRVRRNVVTRWRNIPRNARIFLTFNVVMTIAKIVSTIVVLILDKDAYCPYLKVLLLLYAIRSAIGLPFSAYAHLHPRIQGAPLTTRDIILERQRTLMEIAGTCLFFLSNYFLFTQVDCRVRAPAVFYMTVVHVILGYIVILIPIILCLAVILCLPLVLHIMRALDLGPVVGVKGATDEMIDAIPIVKYRRPVEVATNESTRSTVVDLSSTDDRIEAGTPLSIIAPTTSAPSAVLGAPNSSSVPQSAPQTPKRGLFGFYKRGKKLSGTNKNSDGSLPSQDSNSVEYLTLSDPQDAICAICLCDYENEEVLRKMNCNHYFHKDCVDEWLRLNRCCPLCKRDIEELAGVREPTDTNTGTGTQATTSSPLSSSPSPTLPSVSQPTMTGSRS